jgi:acetoin:2,6-dichlorophenolindophenol oxidoreductase subunit alpha
MKLSINKKTKLSLYSKMKLIRAVEEKLVELHPEQLMKTPFHLYIGQEAIAAGVCLNLKNTDLIFSNHRSHGHYLAKGGNIKNFFSEMYNKKNGCSSGRGGSMHLIDTQAGHMGSSSIMAGTIPISVGAALSFKFKKNKKNVSVCFFGDGAVDEGVLYESFNFASLHKLNVIFVCENNKLSVNSKISVRRPKDNLTEISSSFGIYSKRLDGNDALKVYSEVNRIREKQIKSSMPALIECDTTRLKDHIGIMNDKNYLKLVQKCPIYKLEKSLLKQKILNKDNLKKIQDSINYKIYIANKHGKKSSLPSAKNLKDYTFA